MQNNSNATATIKYAKRWFIDGMGAMALGLFSKA